MVLVHVINKHEANAVNIKVLGLSGSQWTELIPESTLSSGSDLYETFRGSFKQVKVQVKSSKPEKESLIEAYIDGVSE